MTMRVSAGCLVAVVALASGCSPERINGAGSAPTEPVIEAAGEQAPTRAAAARVDIEQCDPAVCEALEAAEQFIELWWYGAPGTTAELVDVAADVITESFAEQLAGSGSVVINKLDPQAHVIAAVEAFSVEADLVVVRLVHRDAGETDVSLTFVDVTDIGGGQWRVVGVATR